ncbi:MAG: response regulator transcription factor [Tahibacter sp.]
MRILIIEDDVTTADWVARSLRERGHVVDVATDGREGLYRATSGEHDIAIVDRMLPAMDGLAVVRALRAASNALPVLMLTALAETQERVEGLNAGADDYLAKPFAFSELEARVLALARRPPLARVETVLRAGDLEMDLVRRTVHRAGKEVLLQAREFQLLEYLLRNVDRVVTRTMLLEHVWEFHFDPKTSVVETHISRLRAKIDRGHSTEMIHTLRGMGYSLRAQH